MLDAPVSVPAVLEGAVLGEAMLAAAGAGRAADAGAAASRFVKEDARFAPERTNAPAYDAAYRIFRELYPRLRDLMRGGS